MVVYWPVNGNPKIGIQSEDERLLHEVFGPDLLIIPYRSMGMSGDEIVRFMRQRDCGAVFLERTSHVLAVRDAGLQFHWREIDSTGKKIYRCDAKGVYCQLWPKSQSSEAVLH